MGTGSCLIYSVTGSCSRVLVDDGRCVESMGRVWLQYGKSENAWNLEGHATPFGIQSP